MVFSYLDPPNWQQRTNIQQEANFIENNHQLPPLPQTAHHHVNNINNLGGSIRPGSMSERARMANIPPPEGPLKCPRCESTNTKFCYYNNYSLSQPRHFCKACRRYWTRGGALRSVPVGGGCRRNKKSRSSNSSSSSSANSAQRQTHVSNSSAGNIGMQSTDQALGHMPQPSHFAFMPDFGNRFGLGNTDLNNLGLNLNGLQSHVGAENNASGQAGMQFGAAGSEMGRNNLALTTAGSMDQWRPQQFSLLGGFDSPVGLYNSLQGEGLAGSSPSSFVVEYSQLQSMMSNSGTSQQAPLKTEGNHDSKTIFRH